MLEGRRVHRPASLRTLGLGLVAAIGLAACGGAGATVVERSDDVADTRAGSSTTVAASSSTSASSTTSTATTAAPTTTAAPPTSTTTTKPLIERVVVETGFAPYAVANPVVLHHPAAAIEIIGFHQASHDGALQQHQTETAARPFLMETRGRGTGDRTAADIVTVPGTEIRAPVTGRVIRAGSYTLYCEHTDEYLVIEPDARPGWEVKVLHIVGLQVRTGDRVEAGVTPVARHARLLPFESQVDDHTAEPSSPHVHVELVDPSIPDRPNPGGGGGCP